MDNTLIEEPRGPIGTIHKRVMDRKAKNDSTSQPLASELNDGKDVEAPGTTSVNIHKRIIMDRKAAHLGRKHGDEKLVEIQGAEESESNPSAVLALQKVDPKAECQVNLISVLLYCSLLSLFSIPTPATIFLARAFLVRL